MKMVGWRLWTICGSCNIESDWPAHDLTSVADWCKYKQTTCAFSDNNASPNKSLIESNSLHTLTIVRDQGC